MAHNAAEVAVNVSDDEGSGGLPPAADVASGSPPTAGVAGRAQRADKAERIRRHAKIAELLGRGTPSGTIVTSIATEFQISERQARTDLAKVRDRWSLEIAKEEPHRRTKLLGTLDTVIAGAINDHAWGAAVAGCRELSKICGLDAPAKVLVSTTGVSDGDRMLLDALKLTNAQRLAEIDKLSAELGKTPPAPRPVVRASEGDDLEFKLTNIQHETEIDEFEMEIAVVEQQSTGGEVENNDDAQDDDDWRDDV